MAIFNKVLIANRGEIACRVVEACKKKSYKTVAVFSDADRNARHVHLADEAVFIGPSTVNQSYLSMDRIIEACKRTNSNAVHPGYGFLSENADFARRCGEEGLIFIGPSPEAIALMGNKGAAKRYMQERNVPCIPGYQGTCQDNKRLLKEAERIGFPIMIKAAAGGGGRGMRLVENVADFLQSLSRARSEALNAFGSDELILEKAISNARHVEIQIIADNFGTILHLGERDCSVQRRHQKVLEESPSPIMTAELRDSMGQSAISAAKAINYTGAGTVEFLVDDEKNFYFLEMNTRLQVEHPVTELVTGLDIVSMQLDIAAGKPLTLQQDQIKLSGHAIEARLYAEDAERNYLPQTGKIHFVHMPDIPGIRIDHGLVEGYEISPYYDSMLAKVVAHSHTREDAIAKLAQALEELAIIGIRTNNLFLRLVLENGVFASGLATTNFLNSFKVVVPDNTKSSETAIVLSAALHINLATKHIPKGFQFWSSQGDFSRCIELEFQEKLVPINVNFKNNSYHINALNKNFVITLLDFNGRTFSFEIDGLKKKSSFYYFNKSLDLILDGMNYKSFDRTHHFNMSSDEDHGKDVRAPMNGRIISIVVKKGDKISKGDTLAVLEAMKMEHQLVATVSGIVADIFANVESQVDTNQIIAQIEPSTN